MKMPLCLKCAIFLGHSLLHCRTPTEIHPLHGPKPKTLNPQQPRPKPFNSPGPKRCGLLLQFPLGVRMACEGFTAYASKSGAFRPSTSTLDRDPFVGILGKAAGSRCQKKHSARRRRLRLRQQNRSKSNG